MTKNIECAERLQAVVDELTAEGACQTIVIPALIEVIVQTAYADHRYADAITQSRCWKPFPSRSRKPSRPRA